MSVLSRNLKQDIILRTEIKNENEVVIDGQYIGQLRGMKLDLDLKSVSLKTDIKSLKKAARQAIEPDLMRRVNKIVKSDFFEIGSDHKIYWNDNPIAYLTAGKNYLNPKIELIVDEAIDEDVRKLSNASKRIEKLENVLKKYEDELEKVKGRIDKVRVDVYDRLE